MENKELTKFSNKELLTELAKRIKAGKIKGNAYDNEGNDNLFDNLYTGKTQGTHTFWKPEFQVDLSDGEITENKIDENADTSDQEEHEKPTK